MPSETRPPRTGLLIAIALLGVFVLYPLSHGPVAWLEWHADLPDAFWDVMNWVYLPLHLVLDNGPEALADLHARYIVWWTPNVVGEM